MVWHSWLYGRAVGALSAWDWRQVKNLRGDIDFPQPQCPTKKLHFHAVCLGTHCVCSVSLAYWDCNLNFEWMRNNATSRTKAGPRDGLVRAVGFSEPSGIQI